MTLEKLLIMYQKSWLRSLRYKIISYRKNGVRKEYRDYKSPTNEEMNEAGEIAIKNGFSDIVLI